MWSLKVYFLGEIESSMAYHTLSLSLLISVCAWGEGCVYMNEKSSSPPLPLHSINA